MARLTSTDRWCSAAGDASGLDVRNFEGADTARLVSGGVEFDLKTFAAPGLFDEFSFNLEPDVTITAIGDFDVLFV